MRACLCVFSVYNCGILSSVFLLKGAVCMYAVLYVCFMIVSLLSSVYVKNVCAGVSHTQSETHRQTLTLCMSL